MISSQAYTIKGTPIEQCSKEALKREIDGAHALKAVPGGLTEAQSKRVRALEEELRSRS